MRLGWPDVPDLFYVGVLGRMVSPTKRDVSVVTPGTVSVTLFGKRVFSDVRKGRLR